MKNKLLYLWQLPQNIIGFILKHISNSVMARKVIDKQYYDFFIANRFNNTWSGVSLGNYVVFAKDKYADETSIKHEYGHQKQSLYLGWLYLIIIGLPSVCGNLFDRFFHKNWTTKKRIEWYYKKLPWERWADELGNVER